MILPPREQPAYEIEGLLRERFTYKESPMVEESTDLEVLDALEGRTAEDTRELSVAEPQPIYTSTIDALLEGRLLKKAYRSGWQYVLVSGEEPQGVIEVTDKPADGPPKTFDVLRPREYAVAMNEVMLRAEQMKGEYELRILRVPAIYLVVLWLVGGKESRLLPVVPPSSQVLKNGNFSERQLTRVLAGLARKRRDTPDLRKGKSDEAVAVPATRQDS
jgi:hypothetical protein